MRLFNGRNLIHTLPYTIRGGLNTLISHSLGLMSQCLMPKVEITKATPHQRPPYQGAYNAPRLLPPQHRVPQTCPPPSYNDVDKVNKKVNDIERMIRGLKESNERMMRTMSEQFAQLAMSNRKKGTFPSQPEANPRGGSSSSFDPNDVRKVNAVISLKSGKKVDSKQTPFPCTVFLIPSMC